MISPILAPTASSRSASLTRATSAGAAPVPRSPTKLGPRLSTNVLAPKRAADRKVVRFGEPRDVAAGGVAPAAAADQHDRAPCRGDKAAHFGEVGRTRMGAHRAIRAGDFGGAPVAQHVLGQGQDDRAGAAGGRDLKRLVDELGDAFGQVDLRHPFGERCHHAAEVDLLKGFAVDLVARNLTDQHDHRGRILKRGVDADRRVARPRPAGHQQHPRLAGELAVGLGHKGGAALLAAGHEPDLGRVKERVKHFEVAFAGDAERHVDAVRAQRRDDQLAAAEGW